MGFSVVVAGHGTRLKDVLPEGVRETFLEARLELPVFGGTLGSFHAAWAWVDTARAERETREQAEAHWKPWGACLARGERPEMLESIRMRPGHSVPPDAEYEGQTAIRIWGIHWRSKGRGVQGQQLRPPPEPPDALRIMGTDLDAYVEGCVAAALVPHAIVYRGRWHENPEPSEVWEPAARVWADWVWENVYDRLEPDDLVSVYTCERVAELVCFVGGRKPTQDPIRGRAHYYGLCGRLVKTLTDAEILTFSGQLPLRKLILDSMPGGTIDPPQITCKECQAVLDATHYADRTTRTPTGEAGTACGLPYRYQDSLAPLAITTAQGDVFGRMVTCPDCLEHGPMHGPAEGDEGPSVRHPLVWWRPS